MDNTDMLLQKIQEATVQINTLDEQNADIVLLMQKNRADFNDNIELIMRGDRDTRIMDAQRRLYAEYNEYQQRLERVNKALNDLTIYKSKLEAQVAELNGEYEAEMVSSTCQICMDEKKTIALAPCGHVIGAKCYKRIIATKTCPICRHEILDSLNIYYKKYLKSSEPVDNQVDNSLNIFHQKYLKYKTKYLNLKKSI